ncbi:MAG: PAS domain S-box protein [Bacillota bacterium]
MRSPILSLESLRRSRLAGIVVALLSVAVAASYVVYLDTPAPGGIMVFAVIVSAWLAGPRPGLLSIVLSMPVLFYYLPPEGWTVDSPHLPRIAYFIGICLFIVWIIAEERRTSASLRVARDQLRRVIDTIPIMAWTVRADGSPQFFNQRWLDYTGLTHDAAAAQPNSTVHPDDQREALARWSAVRDRGEAYEMEMRLRAASGDYRWFLVRTVPVRDEDGDIVQWYGTSTDIEDRKRAEHSAHEYGMRLQQLSRRLIEVQEEERRHLARELHDEFAQLLATIKLHLHAVKGMGEPAALRQRLDQSIALLQSAGEQMRSLALELRPAMLETMGLDPTMRWLARQNEQRTGIETHVYGHADKTPREVAIACFRVTQQAITNVVQHAHARHIWIELRQEDNSLSLVVLDDGVGFDVASTLLEAGREAHLGLLGMRERVEVAGGRLRIDSEAGLGTRIEARFPARMSADELAETAA